MHLILWRHAEAEDGSPDLERELTRKGHKQAADMAKWLHARLPNRLRVITSPAQRARQTASALTGEFEIVPEIAPGASPNALLAATGWPDSDTNVVLVGHQPTVGQAAALLLGGRRLPWVIKKGAVWWLSQRVRADETQVVLRAVMSPDLLK
jgi:phosphohistidine phosphatase